MGKTRRAAGALPAKGDLKDIGVRQTIERRRVQYFDRHAIFLRLPRAAIVQRIVERFDGETEAVHVRT